MSNVIFNIFNTFWFTVAQQSLWNEFAIVFGNTQLIYKTTKPRF